MSGFSLLNSVSLSIYRPWGGVERPSIDIRHVFLIERESEGETLSGNPGKRNVGLIEEYFGYISLRLV